ncbi:MAG: polyprenyl synthetase family protein [Desulfobacterales bacterium]
MTNFDLKTYLARQREKIDNTLNRMLPENPARLVSAMRHSLMAGGKRLRPILCLAAAKAVGGSPEAAMTAACALEMIHTYSLIHDDLPAMDNDELRRGKPTCHMAFDEATAILAGDALLTLAFDILSEQQRLNGEHALRHLQVIHLIARAAGHRGMVEGQMRDMAAEHTLLNQKQLEALHSLKTGALIEASVRCGAILGGGNPEQTDRLGTYAGHIGLAFQVTDDILNVEGDPKIMGKAAGTDQNRSKSTYPSLMGLEQSRIFAEKLVARAVLALEDFDSKSEPLRAVAAYIFQRRH